MPLTYVLSRGTRVSMLEGWSSTLHHYAIEDAGCKVGSKHFLSLCQGDSLMAHLGAIPNKNTSVKQ